MGIIKLTEKESVESVDESAKVVITQPVETDGVSTESVRRATLGALVAALISEGTIDSKLAEKADKTTVDALESSVAEKADKTDVESLSSKVTTILSSNYINYFETDTNDSGNRVLRFFSGTTQVGEDIELAEATAAGLAFDSGYTDESGYLHLTLDGEDIEGFDPFYVGTGGSGGSDTGSVIKISNKMSSKELTIIDSLTTYEIAYSWTSTDTDTSEETGKGSAKWSVNGTQVATQSGLAQGEQSFDVRSYLTNGTANTVKLTIEDSYGTTRSFSWTVTVSSLSLAWNLDALSYHGDEAVNIRLTPSGTGSKSVYVTLDGESIYSGTTTATGRAITVAVAAQNHGAHVIKAWMDLTVDGNVVSTEPLVHTGIWIESGTTDIVVAAENTTLTAKQLETKSIKYMVYDPENETASASIAVDGTTVSTVTVDRTVQTYAYRPTETGEKTLTITSGTASATVTITVESLGYDISEVAGASLTVDPTGHTNTESGYDTFGYTDGSGVNHPFTYSDNFDWTNGGFQLDSDGVTAFVVRKGTYVEFDKSLFSDNARTAGKEIKFIFKAVNVRDYDTELGGCVADNIGIKLQAQQAVLSSNLETVTVPYCEGKKIELDINIESDGSNDNRFAMVWLKGVPSRAFVYSTDDMWQQTNPVNLKIGSDDADVWIYKIKEYPTELTRREILDNYIADCADVEEMVARYKRNDVYGDDGNLNIEKLAEQNQDLRVIHISADRMTTAKSDKVTCTVRQILKSGGDNDNFTAENVTMKAQGTSSLNYIAAAVNIDIDLKSATWTNGAGETITEYAMTENSLPVKYFNIKLNVASSENANNVCLADEYNTYQPFLTPARQADSKVRDTVEGHPCVVFFTNTSSDTVQVSSHTVATGETIFYGCGDINNSKKNTDVFGQDNDTYSDLCCIEILNNNSPQCLFKSDDLTNEDFSGDYYFEPRYPSTLTDTMKAAFQKMLSWVVSTDTTAATDETLSESVTYDGTEYTTDSAEYRAAKFKAEVGDYFSVDSLTYHYLFTERHCMVDNRAKNTFISYEWDTDKEGYRWNFTKDYDNDTADGNDNSGGLTFTYGLEDTDSVNGAKVFNAYDSVLWCNVRDYLSDELEAMYKDRESAGAWKASRIVEKFNDYQSARPEAAYIEDAWAKYIAPYLSTGETRYFGMLYGTKEDQREQFETYQERYMATKYSGALATSDSIEFRASSQIENWAGVEPSGDMTITPYSDMYIIVKYGNAGTVKVRATRGTACTITCPTDNLVDTETYIYLASNITEIGGLAGLYTRVATLSSATRLQKLELGSGETGYSNSRLTQISFGNNPLLEYIDLRGTPNLVQQLDLSSLTSLKEAYLSSSGLTGVTFAVGAPVEKVTLPAVQMLRARSLQSLVSFGGSGEKLTDVWIEDSPNIDAYTYISAATSIVRGRLVNVDWSEITASTDLLLSLAKAKGLDASGESTDVFVLTGKAHIGTVTQDELDSLNASFPDLEITYDEIVPAYTVQFVNADGTVLNTQTVREGSAASNPINSGAIETPTQDPTVELVYTFVGWDSDFSNITADTTITATYYSSTRKYTVNWWYDSVTLIYSERLEVHSTAIYSGDEPTPTDEKIWLGWDTTVTDLQADTDITAVFTSPELPDNIVAAYDYIHSDDESDVSGYTIAQLYGILNAGKAEEFFSIGDKIKIVPTTTAFADSKFILSLVGFNHYKLADDSGDFAQAVFVMDGVMNATHQMNSSATNTTSWENCSMRTFLTNTVYPNLPQQWKALIKDVTVLASAGGTSETIVETTDKLFLLSYAEVGFSTTSVPYKNEIDPDAEQITFSVFTDNNSRIKKYYNGEGDACWWWLRSALASSSSSFTSVNPSGGASYSTATGSGGVSWGFCL